MDFAAILVRLIVILVSLLCLPILEAKVSCKECGTVVQRPLVLKCVSTVPLQLQNAEKKEDQQRRKGKRRI